MVFAFGPLMLVERGWRAAAASSTTSLALWMVVVSVPLGGLIARLGRDRVLALGLVGFAALLLLAPRTSHMVPMVIALGLPGGRAAGPVTSSPPGIGRTG